MKEEPSVSLETLDQLIEINQGKAIEKLLRKYGFTGFRYKEIDGKKQLLINREVLIFLDHYEKQNKKIRKEIQEALDKGAVEGLEAGLAIIRLQKEGMGEKT
jgi:hypothetical protein